MSPLIYGGVPGGAIPDGGVPQFGLPSTGGTVDLITTISGIVDISLTYIDLDIVISGVIAGETEIAGDLSRFVSVAEVITCESQVTGNITPYVSTAVSVDSAMDVSCDVLHNTTPIVSSFAGEVEIVISDLFTNATLPVASIIAAKVETEGAIRSYVGLQTLVKPEVETEGAIRSYVECQHSIDVQTEFGAETILTIATTSVASWMAAIVETEGAITPYIGLGVLTEPETNFVVSTLLISATEQVTTSIEAIVETEGVIRSYVSVQTNIELQIEFAATTFITERIRSMAAAIEATVETTGVFRTFIPVQISLEPESNIGAVLTPYVAFQNIIEIETEIASDFKANLLIRSLLEIVSKFEATEVDYDRIILIYAYAIGQISLFTGHIVLDHPAGYLMNYEANEVVKTYESSADGFSFVSTEMPTSFQSTNQSNTAFAS